MRDILEQSANSYHHWRQRIPSKGLPNFFKTTIWNRLQSKSWRVIDGVHYFINFPGVTFQSPKGKWKTQHPFEFIFDSTKVDLNLAADYLIAAMNLSNDSRWISSNEHTVYGVYGDNAVLSLGDPDKITGIQRYLHTNILAQHLSFVNPPICASTSTYIAANVTGDLVSETNTVTNRMAEEMEKVKARYVGAGQWNEKVRIDGYEQTNYVLRRGQYIVIDPVINES